MSRFHHTDKGDIPFTRKEEEDRDDEETREAAPPTQAEVDVALDAIADDVLDNRGAIKALALTILSEINILRSQAGLPKRTVAQLKAAVRNNAG